MASTYLSRTFGTATSRFTCTASMWVKRSALGSAIFWSSYNSANYRFQFYFDTSDRLNVLNVDNGVNNILVTTTRKFRDTSGWYHLYFAIKSSEATASDRVKIYVNGVRETALDNATYQGTGNDMAYGAPSYNLNIGRYGGGSDYFSGLMSHSYFIDGSIVDVSEFGSTDANGVWTIKTSPTISSYGNEGFFILKDGNSVTDQSGNGNNFTVAGGTLTNTEDNPSNVFATLNPLHKSSPSVLSFSNGNNTITGASSDGGCGGTLAMTSGKWYWEVKYVSGGGSGINAWVAGMVDASIPIPTNIGNGGTLGLYYNGNAWKDTTDLGNFTTQITNGDIVGVGFDADNSDMYFWKNGTALNSGNAVITGISSSTTWMPFGISHTGANTNYTQVNFGNGYFGTTAVASAGTNASGIGIFEYDVPTGFTALSTKGLNL